MSVYHPRTVYKDIFARLVKWLGAADADFPEGGTVAESSPYTGTILRQQIIQSDLEVAALIASVLDHPYRSEYFTESPVVLADGERIPGYIGVHGKVQAQVFIEGDVDAVLANSLEHFDRVKEKIALGGTSAVPARSQRLYWIDNGIFRVISGSGTIEIPTLPFDLDETAPELLTPQSLSNAVLAHAIMTTMPVGADGPHRSAWANVFNAYSQIIMGGGFSLPEPERLLRIAS